LSLRASARKSEKEKRGEAVREPAIDANVPPVLTDADLEKFDVPFGRRKLAAAAPEQGETAPPTPAMRLRDVTALSNGEGNYSLVAPAFGHRPECGGKSS
jgi:hypothetical protein